jgi:hypothetical protein
MTGSLVSQVSQCLLYAVLPRYMASHKENFLDDMDLPCMTYGDRENVVHLLHPAMDRLDFDFLARRVWNEKTELKEKFNIILGTIKKSSQSTLQEKCEALLIAINLCEK